MRHAAIDLGGRESQICVRDETGRIVEERRCATASLGKQFARWERSRITLETCAESFGVADQAIAAGHEVVVVPATLARSLGVGARRIKTDTRDARALSEVSCRIELPSVHIPSEQSRQIKSVCGMREALVECRTKLINTVRGWLRAQARRVRGGKAASFPGRVRELGLELPGYVERQLVAIDDLSEQICAADAEVAALARQSPIAKRLMSVPGVGPVTAVRFLAAIDSIDRFPSSHHVQSYLGLTPGEHSSSDRTRRTQITKAGSPALRWVLVQAAWAARRTRHRSLDPMVAWSLEVERRRGKRVAVVALARKIAGVLYALWRDGRCYNPQRMLDDHARHAQPLEATG